MDCIFWRAKEAAKQLGVSRSTFYSMIQRGLLPKPKRFGSRMSVWDPTELTATFRGLLQEVGRK